MGAHTDHPAGWLLVTSEGAWMRLRREGAWRFADKSLSRAATIRPGDRAIVYLTQHGRKESALAALVEFQAPPTTKTTPALFDSMYPHRAPFCLVAEPKEPVPFRPLIPTLSFIENARNYGMYLQGQAIKPLDPHDLDLLTTALEEAA